MRTITTAELIAANQKAFAENRLTAQRQGEIFGSYCRYTHGEDCGCAIGVALNETERAKINELRINTNVGVERLVNSFHVVQFEDYNFAERLQAAHDDICVHGWDKYKALINVQ
jgi:hypothetical protein